MTGYLLRRLVAIVAVLIFLLAITFVIFYVFPANPARDICGKGCTAQSVSSIDHALGLNKPLYTQFWQYLEGIFAGRTIGTGPTAQFCAAPCLGFSFQDNVSVTSMIWQRLPVTVSIASGAAVLWMLFGLGSGVLAALRKNTWIDRAATSVSFAGLSLPVFLLAIVMLYLLSTKWKILPQAGYTGISSNPVLWFEGLIQPWIALALGYAAIYSRFTRAKMIEAMEEPYITTARAKGLRESRVVVRHGLRAAIGPVITIFGIDFGGLLGGSIITEQVYGLPGVGQMFIQAVGKTDIPVVTGVTLLAGAFVVLANLVVDLVYGVLDPRVRLG